jgi:hypothetical protein
MLRDLVLSLRDPHNCGRDDFGSPINEAAWRITINDTTMTYSEYMVYSGQRWRYPAIFNEPRIAGIAEN